MDAKPHAPAKRTKLHIAFKEREYFTENLALLIKSGVPVGQALESLAVSAKSRTTKKALARMQTDIEAGYSLANSLDRSGIVGSQTLALIRLGEESGHLIQNLQLAAQQEEKRHTFRSKVRSALIYPAFVMSLTLVVGLGVAWFLLPKLAQTFSQLHASLPAISQYLIAFGLFLQQYGAVAVPGALAVLALIGYVVFAAPGTKFIGQKLLFALPGVGRLMHEVEIAQFGYLLSTLLEAGLPIVRSIELLAHATTARPYQKFYDYLAHSLSDGYSIEHSLKSYKHSAKLIPPAVQQMIISGERSGSLSDVLKTIGRTYEQKADLTTQNLEAIIEPIMLVIVWLGVMAVAVAVIIPIYSLVGGLSQ